jgi:ABC-2 type transport system permease protein
MCDTQSRRRCSDAPKILLLFGATGVYLIVALALGLWISTVVNTQQQAMFVTFFMMVLYLFMSGLFTPVASMPTWAEWVAELSPLKHFIEVIRAVLMKGAGLLDVCHPIGILAGYGAVVLAVAVRQHSKTKAWPICTGLSSARPGPWCVKAAENH